MNHNSVINGFPNPFAPSFPPSLFTRAYCDGNDVAFYANDEIIIDITPPTTPSTPPLRIREDLYEVIEITQEEFLASIEGWTPIPINHY